MSARHALLAVIAALSFAACSDSSESDTATPTTAAAATDATQAEPEPERATEPEAEAAAEQPQVFELMTTEATAPGPRPLLAWASVDGAATYDLVVLDSSGDPYWAWSGEATSINIGGVENPDAIGAWVFEPLTWIVTARDAEGQPLAMSAKAELLP